MHQSLSLYKLLEFFIRFSFQLDGKVIENCLELYKKKGKITSLVVAILASLVHPCLFSLGQGALENILSAYAIKDENSGFIHEWGGALCFLFNSKVDIPIYI